MHTAVIQVDGIEAEDLDGLVEALSDDEHQVIFIDGLITLNADEEEGVEPLTIPSDKIVIINDEATLASGNVGIVNEGIIIVNGVLQTDPDCLLYTSSCIYKGIVHGTFNTLINAGRKEMCIRDSPTTFTPYLAVSMNLTDYTKTSIYRVFETIKMEAARYGVNVVGSEIIGLIPLQALVDTAEYYLCLEDFKYDQVLETRL